MGRPFKMYVVTTPEDANDTSVTSSPIEVAQGDCYPAVIAQARRETLTSRAKRVIGRTLEVPKDKKDSKDSAKASTKQPTEKRREQVLKAQRFVIFAVISDSSWLTFVNIVHIDNGHKAIFANSRKRSSTYEIEREDVYVAMRDYWPG
jgi:hypothetical protein